MKAWQIERYGTTAEMNYTTTRIPVLRSPDDILIKVHAASVNPIDTRMLGGYGRVLFNKSRQVNDCKLHLSRSEFPLILGRDCSGVVQETGQNIAPNLIKPGDEVWAALHLAKSGTHAEYVLCSLCEVTYTATTRTEYILCSLCEVTKKPASLSHTQSASIPYVAGTTCAALHTGCLTKKNARNKK
ncbi:Reticulon-4-interacting protein 1, mitochondrial [Lamellibrachia satsuma]|nr:Reticulon-4-interacting protein 1, mitochondrial [Lamellibrachia satsuma]